MDTAQTGGVSTVSPPSVPERRSVTLGAPDPTCRCGVLEDPLTGLGNAALVMTELEGRLTQPTRTTTACVLMLLDVDGFTTINESLGHRAGDELLREVGRRLRNEVPEGHTIARVATDEFAVVLDGLPHPDSTAAVAESLRRAMREPMLIGGTLTDASVSVGVAASPAPDAVTLWSHADVALRDAQRLGGDRCELFSYSPEEGRTARRELVRDLRVATREHQLRVCFQPLVSACGQITGAEALVRWFHPTRGAISPVEFIPVAEETDLIREIEAFVLDTSLHELTCWWCTGRTDLTIHVNLSAKNLDDPTLIGTVETLVAQHHVPASALCLEITETALISDLAGASLTIEALAGLGVRLALDDFGIGYSSLVHLRQLPVDALKLDRCFINGIDANADDAAIVHSTIDLAHTLGLQAVAEGVETERQACQLWDMGCDQAQGFHWSPAVPPDALADMLRRDQFPSHTAQTPHARADARLSMAGHA